MWITKLLVEKLNKEDKKIDEKISEGVISGKDAFIKGYLIGSLEGIIDYCLILGAIRLVTGTIGTIKLITKK